MRKLSIVFIAIAVSIIFARCSPTSAIKYTDFRAEMDSIEICLNKMGYEKKGYSDNTQNKLYVKGTSYTPTHGYGTALGNNYITTERYSFGNSDGDSMSFTVSYRLFGIRDCESMDKIICVQNIDVSQCDVSSPKDYNKVCGDSSPIQKIEELRPKPLNQSSSEDQSSSGIIAALFIALAIPAFLIAIRLSH